MMQQDRTIFTVPRAAAFSVTRHLLTTSRTCWLALLCAAAAQAQHYADGLYALSSEPSDGPVIESGGVQYWLADRVELDLDEVTIFATDNFNEHFAIRLGYLDETVVDGFVSVILDPDYVPTVYALVLDERTYPMQFLPMMPGRLSSQLQIAEEGVAVKAAALFSTDVLYRHHPGHRLQARFVPQSQTVALGDAVDVELEITNVGEHDLRFECCAWFSFTFSGFLHGETVPNIGARLQPQGVGSWLTLRAGESRRASADLNRWFELSEPGEYVFHGAFPIDLVTSGDPMRMRVIWSDRVSGRFSVTIEE